MIITNFIDGDKHYSQGSWEGGKPETLFPWGESGRILYRVLGSKEILKLCFHGERVVGLLTGVLGKNRGKGKGGAEYIF